MKVQLGEDMGAEPVYTTSAGISEPHLNDILLKGVNKSAISESVNIILTGSENINPDGHASTLTGVPDTVNSLTNPTNVVPSTNTFIAGKNFKYSFPAYSVTVLRIGILR